jgi:hypothetical protein
MPRSSFTALRECVLDAGRDCCVAKLGPEIGSKIPCNNCQDVNSRHRDLAAFIT